MQILILLGIARDSMNFSRRNLSLALLQIYFRVFLFIRFIKFFLKNKINSVPVIKLKLSVRTIPPGNAQQTGKRC